jgi:hypothetical protein
MTLPERVAKTVEDTSAEFAKEPRFVELKAFYEQMLRNGIAIKRPYEIGQLDTIGRDVYLNLTRSEHP